ncbi:Putative heat shock protein YegD [Salmonella enterica subsp. enterica]|uniref:Heat shock protein YegD n=1 Tax=Salmonella enterica I TaxID=59201 RepID=A0A447N7Y9_SALET|nr:Putative heat shock protein YegD [Salmonella enterica subsp. enterica]
MRLGAQSVQFGLASLAHYIDDPQEVWFVKSPKSFLGASGLKPQQVALFEDLVCAMMVHIRHTAHSQLAGGHYPGSDRSPDQLSGTGRR